VVLEKQRKKKNLQVYFSRAKIDVVIFQQWAL